MTISIPTSTPQNARPKLIALDGGTGYHKVTFEDPKIAEHIDHVIYIRDLCDDDLIDAAGLIIACRTPAEAIVPHAARIRAFLDRGGLVVAMGDTGQEKWLPDVSREQVETNFWWWLEPGADLGLEIARPDHDLFTALGKADVSWHLHDLFDVPAGAVSLVDYKDGRSVLYEDTTSFKGRLVVTSLDPMYHHGAYFMPATTRFLYGFIPWVRRSLDAGNQM
ncbi:MULTISPECIES: hypothetical protein [Thalassospira]|uniref:Uncharacterized protein n=1 Tax=Thalassospira aquimaris TaxID=3037796 RepID=A0ABT6G9P8_9PROT|nr:MULTISPECIES: hypothetical protein [Thalassospira]MDG4718795.1 hypothetical protein [Thalassospira sp. FZY0004]